MRSNVTKRIQFNHILAGILSLINKPSYYKQFGKLIYPDLIYPSDQSDNVEALKAVIRLLAELDKENRVDEFSLKFIQSEISLRFQDEVKSSKIHRLYSSWIVDKELMSLMEDVGIFNSFVSYIKALQVFQIADKFSKDLNENKVDSAVELMHKALRNIAAISNTEKEEIKKKEIIDFIKKDNKPEIKRQVLLLGCPPIDALMGGFERQTLTGFIGKTGGGKSMMAHHLIAQCIEQGIYAWVGAVEDRKKSFIYKLMSRLSGIPMRRLKTQFDHLSPAEFKALSKASDDIDRYVKVEFLYGCSVDEVNKAAIDYDTECKIKNLPIPIVNVVDYTGHIAIGSYGDKMYEKMRVAYGARKNFVLKNDKIGFDFAQINREGSKNMSNNHIITQNDLAGSYDLSQIFDNLISLNRNEEDIINGYSKLHICKARDAAVGATVQVKTEFHKSKYQMKDWCLISGNSEMVDICKELGNYEK